MPGIPEGGVVFDLDAYLRGHDLLAGRRPLHSQAVEMLAEEVVQHLAERVQNLPHAPAGVTGDDVDALCTALISDDAGAPLAMILDRFRAGASPDSLYLGYIAGAARRLGSLWEDDLLPFYDVTVAAGRIFGLLRAMRFMFVPPQVTPDRRALFATVPGEDHAIGVTIAADMFRREGWDVELCVGLGHQELLAEVRGSGIRLVAVSAGSRRSLLPLARLVVALHVMHPPAAVMVSGRLTVDEPDFVGHVGADAVARDVPEALAEMERLNDLRLGRRPPLGAELG